MAKGLNSAAMNVLGVQADIVCPKVTANNSVIKMTRKL